MIDDQDDTGPTRRVPVDAMSRNACPTASSRGKRRRIRFSVSSAAGGVGGCGLGAGSCMVGWVANRRTYQGGQDQDRRDQEEGGQSRGPLNSLTEPREHRRKTGRGEAAASMGPVSVRTRRACTTGDVPQFGGFRSAAECTRKRTWGRRAIDQPAVTARRLAPCHAWALERDAATLRFLDAPEFARRCPITRGRGILR